MKSWNHLFQATIDKNNMLIAMRAAAKDKGAYKSVQRAAADPSAYADKLIHTLESGDWKPPVHHPVEIHDGIKQKKRMIIKPTYGEQVVHHAIIQVLEPVFMHSMYDFSCGSVPNRGATYGKKYLQRYIKNNSKQCRYCLKIDIRHFFESIDQDILMNMLGRKIKDKKMLELLDIIIRSEGRYGIGIPIGFYTSQWLSNFFLEGLDHYIKEELKVRCYVRYMDDMVMLGSNKRQLRRVLKKIDEYLKSINLTMKSNWQIFKFDYIDKYGTRHGRFIDFMGFRFYRDKTILRRSIFLRACRKARRLRKKQPNWYSACQMISYLGYLSQADTYEIFSNLIKPLINVKALKRMVSKHDKRRAIDGIL